MKAWMILPVLLVPIAALLGFCFNYSLWAIMGKNVPWYVDVIGGVVTSAFVVATAVVC